MIPFCTQQSPPGLYTYILVGKIPILDGGNSNIFYFHPYLGKMNPFWLIFFQMGLVQPPAFHLLESWLETSGRKFPVGPPRPTSRWMWTSNCAPIATRWAFLGLSGLSRWSGRDHHKKPWVKAPNCFMLEPLFENDMSREEQQNN